MILKHAPTRAALVCLLLAAAGIAAPRTITIGNLQAVDSDTENFYRVSVFTGPPHELRSVVSFLNVTLSTTAGPLDLFDQDLYQGQQRVQREMAFQRLQTRGAHAAAEVPCTA